MDWTKVVAVLDDEVNSRRQAAEKATDTSDRERWRLTADIAFMLRDSLYCGLSDEDRKKLITFDR